MNDRCFFITFRGLHFTKSLLATSKILGLFINTFTVDEKYCLCNRENLQKPIQMQVSKKQETFSQFFAAIQKFLLNLQHFEKKITLIGYVFPNLQTRKFGVTKISRKPGLRTALESQQVKESQTLLKSTAQQFYHVFSLLSEDYSCEKSLLVISKILGLFLKH